MGLFGSIFNKEKTHKGYFELAISQVIRLNGSSVKIEFDIPKALQSKFNFTAGQFINVLIQINGKEERRSYSICSANEEALAIGVKRVQGGAVSNWLNNEAREGTKFLSQRRKEILKFLMVQKISQPLQQAVASLPFCPF